MKKKYLGDEAPMPQSGVKPTITERPIIRQAANGSEITFQCRCVGDPKPTIHWYSFKKIDFIDFNAIKSKNVNFEGFIKNGKLLKTKDII